MQLPDAREIAFTTVVVGVDGREGSREATALALELMEPDGRLILVRVIRPRGGAGLAALFADADRRAAVELLHSERRRLEISVSTVVSVSGSIREGLTSIVEENDADLLVVASAHRGAMGRVLFGDGAREALNGARCAVAIAPCRPAHSPEWHAIAVGDDGSAESARALALAHRLAEPTGARIRACSVIGPAGHSYREVSRMDQSQALARRAFEERKRLSALPGVQAEVLEGDAGEALAELGREVDLLIVGSRGQGAWGRLATGSTADYLAGHATCPVLVLPRGLKPAGALAPDAPSPDPLEPAAAAP